MSAAIGRLYAHKRVESIDDERSLGNGVIVTLRQGFTWDLLQDNRVRGFNSLNNALKAVNLDSKVFLGPYNE